MESMASGPIIMRKASRHEFTSLLALLLVHGPSRSQMFTCLRGFALTASGLWLSDLKVESLDLKLDRLETRSKQGQADGEVKGDDV